MENVNIYILLGAAINILWLSALTFKLVRLLNKNAELFSSSKKGNVYDVVNNYLLSVRRVSAENAKIKEDLEGVSKLFKKSFQKSGIVRYNPFTDIGGELSFSLAVLDFEESGFILTNIHNREGDRIYLKSIKKGSSEQNLSEEESEALKRANKLKEGRKEKNV